MRKPLASDCSALNARTRKPIPANDDLSLYAVLTTRPDCITYAIVGDDDLEREHSRRFEPQDSERADLYAYEVTATLDLSLTFSMMTGVDGDA